LAERERTYATMRNEERRRVVHQALRRGHAGTVEQVMMRRIDEIVAAWERDVADAWRAGVLAGREGSEIWI
jgi:enoyl-CoA hydratase/carnithine racemase